MKSIIINKKELENTALQLKSLLAVLSATDSDNTKALYEMPIALEVAANIAENLYCAIVDAKETGMG